MAVIDIPRGGAWRAGKRRDTRVPVAAAVLGAIALLGAVVAWMPGRSVIGERAAPPDIRNTPPAAGFEALQTDGRAARDAASEEIVVVEQSKEAPADAAEAAARTLLRDAARAIRAHRYDQAIAMLDRGRPEILRYPESYLLVGRALEGKKDYAVARDFFNAALDRDPSLAEAYWGMATTSEALGDLETALGGMRSFLHSVPDPDPYRLKVAQARSALWEWEAKLGRGPWGPTKGIIPGLTPEQAAKNDKGVGIMMPLPGTEQPDGSRKFEVKNQDRFEVFKKK